jgi:hypothetical protein
MSTNSYWWISLGLVWSCYSLPRCCCTFPQAGSPDRRRAEQIWATGKQVARNTATTWMLGETSRRLDALTEEALRHDAFLRGWRQRGRVSRHASIPRRPDGLEIVLFVGVLAIYLNRIAASLKRIFRAHSRKSRSACARSRARPQVIGPGVVKINGQLAVIAGALDGVADSRTQRPTAHSAAGGDGHER